MGLWQWAWVWVWLAVVTDSDQARLLAVAQFIGEKPVIFVNSGSSPGFFHRILVGALVVAFFFLLFQFCTHMSCQKGA